MKKKEKLFISLIIPAYKQEKTIEKDLQRIRVVMDSLRHDYEIIVVVDGKVDRTLQNAKKVHSNKISITGYRNNHGKGYAIRFGMVRSKGNIVGFIDSGMDLDPNGLSLLLEHFQWYEADVMIGSKRHPVSKVNYPANRKVISLFSQLFIRILFGINVRDTQVGMKFFKRNVIEDVLPRLLVKRFAFDIEILVVSHYLGYKRIYEAPVELTFNPEGSSVSKALWNALFWTFWDSAAIFYRLRLLHYYDNQNKRHWKYDPDLQFKVNLP